MKQFNLTCALLIVITFFLKLPIALANSTQIMSVAKCAQDIVDYKHGAEDGISFAAELLQNLVTAKNSDELSANCTAFKSANSKTNITRSQQLKYLLSLKPNLNSEVYFFLRGAIRPLIVCRQSLGNNGIIRTCVSSTGKSWYELSLRDSFLTSSTLIYRLGHSQTPGGIAVIGPQDYFDEEDRQLIQALPQLFSREALAEIPKELNNKYIKAKVMMLPRTDKFIEYYFVN